MEMTIWDIVRSISVILSHAFTLGILSDHKDSVRHPAAVWTYLSLVLAPALIIIITPTGYTTTTTWLAYFLILIPYFIVFMFISEGPVKRNLFLFMSYSTLFVLLLVISQILAILFADGEESVQIMTRTVMSLLFALAVLWKLKDLFIRISEFTKRVIFVFYDAAIYQFLNPASCEWKVHIEEVFRKSTC